MDISLLPEEVFIEIALHLNIRDLLSCSLVSSNWRNAINQNKIWFKQCEMRSCLKYDSFELIETPNRVKPKFEFPIFCCDSLPELCPWRRRFMQEAHITRNWRFGQYVPHPIINLNDLQLIECDENVIVVPHIEMRHFTVFSIENDPKQIEIVPYSLNHVSSDFFKLCQNILVVIQCTLMQAFEKTSDNSFKLSHRRLFNKPQEDSLSIPESEDISVWYRNNIGLYPSDIDIVCDHNGKYFVGLVLEGDLNKAELHIWNLATGEKSAVQKVPEINEKILDVHFSLHKSNLNMLLTLSASSSQYTTIYSYNLVTFQFTNLVLTYDYVVPVVLFGDNFILNSDHSGKSVMLWRNDSGELVKKIRCSYALHPMTIQFAYSFVILAGNFHGTGYVKVFNTNTLNTYCEFAANYKVSNLLFVRSNMVLVGGWMNLGLWDIETATKLHTFDYHDCIWTNPGNTKLVVQADDELFLLNFW